MSTAVMTLGSLQQHRVLAQPSSKKMVMMLSPPLDMQQHQIQSSNGACVIVSSGYPTGHTTLPAPPSPPQFTNLDVHMSIGGTSTVSTATTTIPTSTTSVITSLNNNNNNNNNCKTKNNNLNKVPRVPGGAVQKRPIAPGARGSVLVSTTVVTSSPSTTTSAAAAAAAADALRCKRRIQFSGAGATGNLTFAGHQPASVARRNARERNRVKQVNNGFATLRSHIPPAIAAALQESSGCPSPTERSSRSSKDKEAAKKLSKVETLRMAVEYIRSLQAMLVESGAGACNENTVPGSSGARIKTESVLADSPTGFDGDYETALALSHYSSAPQGHSLTMSLSPPCSDASSSSSPTPSYVSDGSVGASSTGYAPHGPPTYVGRVVGSAPVHLQCRQHIESPSTPPDSSMYEPMSAEDEELLDVISWWQQTN